LSSQTPSQWDNVLFDVMDVPLRYLIFTIGLYITLRLLLPGATPFIEHLVRSIVILIVFNIIYRTIGQVALSRSRLIRMTGLTVEDRLVPFLRTSLRLIIVAILFVILVQEWGYDVGGLVTALGLGGLAFSLAAQDLLSNIFGFSAIVGDAPFIVGDFIKTPDVEGTVEHVGLRSTQLRRPDQAFVTMPNSKLASSAILNWNRLSKRWLNFTLVVAYGPDSNTMRTLLDGIRNILKSRETVEQDSIIVNMVNFGQNGLEVLVRCYILIADWGPFTQERELINLEILTLIERLDLRLAAGNVIQSFIPNPPDDANVPPDSP
jgi:MscS family membrane protein